MNPRMISIRLALALVLVLPAVLALPALAVPPAPESLRAMPGYMDLDWIHIPDGAAEIQDVVLDPVLAGLAANLTANPFAAHCCSVSPTHASSGDVYTTPGITL